MFNRLNHQHLIQTTVANDAIKIAYINCHTLYHLLNPFAKTMPTFLSTDLSSYFGEHGCVLEPRLGVDFRVAARRELESVFCIVLFCNDEKAMKQICNQIDEILGDSKKRPPIVLASTDPVNIAHSAQDMLKEKIAAQTIEKSVTLPELHALKETPHKQNTCLFSHLSLAIGELYSKTASHAAHAAGWRRHHTIR